MIDKRDHIAGNVYTQETEGINVHVYGAHIFHTNNKEVWDYVNRFAEFNRFTINGATEIEAGFSAVGSYSAYLLDSNNKKTMSCTWAVENP